MIDENGNAIPLPPRDRSKPLNVAKTRHQRKHPLIIPGGEQRLLDKLNAENESSGNPMFGGALFRALTSASGGALSDGDFGRVERTFQKMAFFG